MAGKVYLVVTRKRTSNTPDAQESYTISNEVFENRDDARALVMQDEDFVGSPSWVEDKDGNETVGISSNERTVRWEIRSLPVRPYRQ